MLPAKLHSFKLSLKSTESWGSVQHSSAHPLQESIRSILELGRRERLRVEWDRKPLHFKNLLFLCVLAIKYWGGMLVSYYLSCNHGFLCSVTIITVMTRCWTEGRKGLLWLTVWADTVHHGGEGTAAGVWGSWSPSICSQEAEESMLALRSLSPSYVVKYPTCGMLPPTFSGFLHLSWSNL